MDEPITPELILNGYAAGVFPMAEQSGAIFWYSPDPRCIFEFDKFHVPRSLRPLLRKGKFEIRVDTCFDVVIRACGDRPEGTWISDEIRELYCELHRQGFAHSVEAWHGGKLAGGLYGVTLGGVFFGESMFHRVADASKVALVALMERLKRRGFELVDTQWPTPHLVRFGAIEIAREAYLKRLEKAIRLPCEFAE